MKKAGIIEALLRVRVAKAQWAVAQTKFNSDTEAIMSRLLHEAAAARMSPEEVANYSGFTAKRIRMIMRIIGLNPRDGKNLLSKKAAEALADNAALLGIEPSEMDLMSPLAYLPMGPEMKRELQAKAVSQVASVSGNVAVDPEHIVALESIVAQSDGVAPVSVESLVNMALDAFLDGLNE